MWLWLAACGKGVIRTPEGTDRLRGALYISGADSSYPNVSTDVVILANSELDCELAQKDPSTELSQVQTAFAREGGRIVLLFLYYADSRGAVGSYNVVASANGSLVGSDQGVAGAAYWGVNEALLLDQDGIRRTYQPGTGPGETVYEPDVGAPGSLDVTKREDGLLAGTFDLDSVHVSGTFRAEECKPSTLVELATLFEEASPDTGNLEVPPYF